MQVLSQQSFPTHIWRAPADVSDKKCRNFVTLRSRTHTAGTLSPVLNLGSRNFWIWRSRLFQTNGTSASANCNCGLCVVLGKGTSVRRELVLLPEARGVVTPRFIRAVIVTTGVATRQVEATRALFFSFPPPLISSSRGASEPNCVLAWWLLSTRQLVSSSCH